MPTPGFNIGPPTDQAPSPARRATISRGAPASRISSRIGPRGAVNAVSYFQAKAANPSVGWHGGCGPIAISITRSSYMVLINLLLKAGTRLLPVNAWASGDPNTTTDWGLWWFNYDNISSTLIDGRIVGSTVRLTSSTPLNYAVRVGHAWEQDCAGSEIYDSNGQLCLPMTPEMLLSA
jgi:hypothetical protein